MTKITPHPIEDAHLLAYLEGAAAPEIAARIEADPQLQWRVSQLAQEEARLRLFLAPTEDENDLSLHSPTLGDKIQVLLARLIAPLRQSRDHDNDLPWSPQLIPVRGFLETHQSSDPASKKLAFEAGEIFIFIDIKPTEPPNYALRGYVLGWDESDARVQMWRDNEILWQGALDEDDEFFVDVSPSGTYQIVLKTADSRIILEPFSLI